MSKRLWFWAWVAEICLKKDSLNAKRPVGEVWENLILISASDEKEAYKKAVKTGKKSNGDSNGTLRLDGKPAVSMFLGITDMGVIHEPISDGVEILFRSRRETLKRAKQRVKGKTLLADVKQELKYV